MNSKDCTKVALITGGKKRLSFLLFYSLMVFFLSACSLDASSIRCVFCTLHPPTARWCVRDGGGGWEGEGGDGSLAAGQTLVANCLSLFPYCPAPSPISTTLAGRRLPPDADPVDLLALRLRLFACCSFAAAHSALI